MRGWISSFPAPRNQGQWCLNNNNNNSNNNNNNNNNNNLGMRYYMACLSN